LLDQDLREGRTRHQPILRNRYVVSAGLECPAMRVINRTAVSITGAQPYVDWTRQTDADSARGMLTVVRARPYGTAVLLPEFELEEDVQEWIEENASWLFEFQLAAWTDDESSWPAVRDLKTFREWFRVDVHSVVVDVADTEIEGDEL